MQARARAGEALPADVAAALAELHAARAAAGCPPQCDGAADASRPLHDAQAPAQPRPGPSPPPMASCSPEEAASPCAVLGGGLPTPGASPAGLVPPGPQPPSEQPPSAAAHADGGSDAAQPAAGPAGPGAPAAPEPADWAAREARVRAAAALMPARADVLVADLLDFRRGRSAPPARLRGAPRGGRTPSCARPCAPRAAVQGARACAVGPTRARARAACWAWACCPRWTTRARACWRRAHAWCPRACRSAPAAACGQPPHRPGGACRRPDAPA